MQIQNNSPKRIADLDVSDDFKTRAENMGIHCLQDVLDRDILQIKAHPQFTYLWYTDLLNILQQENLLDEFQDKLSG
jgi:hypothetical protein